MVSRLMALLSVGLSSFLARAAMSRKCNFQQI
jgi:hypothetical protein